MNKKEFKEALKIIKEGCVETEYCSECEIGNCADIFDELKKQGIPTSWDLSIIDCDSQEDIESDLKEIMNNNGIGYPTREKIFKILKRQHDFDLKSQEE